MATPSQAFRIGLIISTVRQPRFCPQVARFVNDTITTLRPSSSSTKLYTLTTIDLLDHPLPFHDEPAIPAQITSSDAYVHDHTRAWSKLISSFDGFIFVTPQYNWGYPAVLKNAIDYLFNEWVGKPAMVVSYGGHGGNKANAQLRSVLGAIKMDVVDRPVELTFGSREVVGKASKGVDMQLDGTKEDGFWSEKRGEIAEVFEEFLAKGKKEA